MKSEKPLSISLKMDSFCIIFAVILVTFKLAGIITWSWLAVLAPIWLPLVLAGFAVFFGLMILTILALFGIRW